ncbi:hypothetical protein, partial [Paenibacillus odorifer]|uniref:hypothetical protein n=1 Tax=Paenibacillus odorifer TaxID=189426 RepID=UPI0015C2C2A5
MDRKADCRNVAHRIGHNECIVAFGGNGLATCEWISVQRCRTFVKSDRSVGVVAHPVNNAGDGWSGSVNGEVG